MREEGKRARGERENKERTRTNKFVRESLVLEKEKDESERSEIILTTVLTDKSAD